MSLQPPNTEPVVSERLTVGQDLCLPSALNPYRKLLTPLFGQQQSRGSESWDSCQGPSVSRWSSQDSQIGPLSLLSMWALFLPQPSFGSMEKPYL